MLWIIILEWNTKIVLNCYQHFHYSKTKGFSPKGIEWERKEETIVLGHKISSGLLYLLINNYVIS